MPRNDQVTRQWFLLQKLENSRGAILRELVASLPEDLFPADRLNKWHHANVRWRLGLLGAPSAVKKPAKPPARLSASAPPSEPPELPAPSHPEIEVHGPYMAEDRRDCSDQQYAY